ncbi:MAG: hypothetical protein HOP15_00195 [Planctomycetes bacterium]|nr:hypothetical protein [Planctomycetota bacterium]
MKAVLWLALVACQITATDVKLDGDRLRMLSNDALLREYEAAGTALDRFFPMDGSVHRLAWTPRPLRLNSAQNEIVRRGRTIVPGLIGFLQQEVPKSRPNNPQGVRLSFTSDVLHLLVKIGDERAAPVIMRILSGFDGQADLDERRAALDAIRQLTHVCFSTIDPSNGYCGDAVQHADARPVEHWPESMEEPAELYRRWLEGEGLDPSQWLAIARRQARSELATEHIDRIYCAATFLRAAPERDDDPDATLARLMHVIERMKRAPQGGPYDYQYEGVLASLPIGNYFHLAAGFGPRARPYSGTLIRLQREMGETAWGAYEQLRRMGGNEILAHFIERLPRVDAEVAKIDADPARPEAFKSDDPRLAWLQTQWQIRCGIDRWAGRLFDGDADRIAWWESNKTMTSEQQLRPNLALLMKQADEDTASFAVSLAREVLPEAPVEGAGPFRQAWLEAHRTALVYDENAGVFRVK